jgi:aspartyl-tRNA synthetase
MQSSGGLETSSHGAENVKTKSLKGSKRSNMQVDSIGDWKRTHDCGSLRIEDVAQEAILMGWVNRRRDLGNLIFVDLRDRQGETQIVFDPQEDEESLEKAHRLRNEWVLAVKGRVAPRLEGQANPHLPTGAVELKVTDLKILNETEVPPYQVDGAVDASETLRLRYRYLELRRRNVFENFRKRHLIAATIRRYLDEEGFIEVETPFLTKSTPEGARDYLVPSRINKSQFYALPQSPQLFKQLLMIAGFDRYYQIVRCFRDEDLRADRQPEFTQVDLEMAFANESDVMEVVEGMVVQLFKVALGKEVDRPIPRLEYGEAMKRFGTDRPDRRFGMELIDMTDLVANSDFEIFRRAIETGGSIKAIKVEKGAASFSRKDLDGLANMAKDSGARGLAWAKVTESGWQSSIAKFLAEGDREAVDRRLGASAGDLILIVADSTAVVCQALGVLRLAVAKRLDLVKEGEFALLWVTNFPLLEYSETDQRLEAVHHPFTAPLEDDLSLLENDPEHVRARSYDLVLNGTEVGGGSVRIHLLALQRKMFQILGISPQEADQKFGFFLEALKYGAPPHAGIALGFDRLVATLLGVESIRDVIAFPKTQRATCPLTHAPSPVDTRQLDELGLRLMQ